MFKKNSMLSKYCWATGFLSIPISVALYFTNDPLSGIFVGLWVAPLMILARNAES
jgi:hypothetical protein